MIGILESLCITTCWWPSTFFFKERVSPKCKGSEMWGMLENLPRKKKKKENLPRRAGEVHH